MTTSSAGNPQTGAPSAGLSASPSTHKAFRSGTHRAVAPEDTVERLRGILPALAITRVANVTGLDNIGIPVVMVCRPNSKSLAVSQGKGLTLAAAKASGIMEALELFHAERITLPVRFATHNEIRFAHRVVDVDRLPRSPLGPFRDDLKILWIEAVDLIQGGSTWVPFETVHIDCTRPVHPGAGSFRCSSNGLASGNNVWEATIHAVTEVIEREGLQSFAELSPVDQDARRVRLDTIDDADALGLLDHFERAQVDVMVWETTERTGIPAFKAAIVARADGAYARIGTFSGAGCHPSRSVALCRALTEAAQTRLTVISGARDDMPRALYEFESNPDRAQRERERFAQSEARRSFTDIPTLDTDDFAADSRWLMGRLEAAGFDSVLLVDLTMPAFGIPVVRTVVPGTHGVGGLAPNPPLAAE